MGQLPANEIATDSFDAFRDELREALTHLHDPDYRPPAALCRILGFSADAGAGPIQQEIIRAIRGLQPPADVPPGAADWRDFEILNHRFICRLTQEEVADRLHMSPRHVRRAQRIATHRLARLLWEHGLAHEAAPTIAPAPPAATPEMAEEDDALDWRRQVRQSLASLQASGNAVVADVREAVGAAVELERVLCSRHGITLQVDELPSGLLVAMHPSVLRQVLIMAIADLVRSASPGRLNLRAFAREGKIHIELSCPTPGDAAPAPSDLVSEILAAQDGAVEVHREGECAILRLSIPAAGEVTVLVVDDNPDSIHYYRRCVTGTRYRIVHASQGEAALHAAEQHAPDIILLDIMLPGTDGWELLRLLRESPATRSVPVIVCSVVREADLASALGAMQYLPKPVRRQDLLQALDRAAQAATASERQAQGRS